MKRKIIGIGVCMLMIASAILPVAGTIQEPKNTTISQLDGPTLEWSFITGGPYQDMLFNIYETDDKGFITSGITENPKDVFSGWVIKLDQYGKEEWRNIETEIQGNDYYTFGISDVCQTYDGGYLVAGLCDRVEDLKYGFLWKLNANGETEWFNSAYNGESPIGHYSICPWNIIPVVNGYLLTGAAYYWGELYLNDADAFLMKVDLAGNEVWKQIYMYGQDHDEGRSICSTLDGGYLITGTVNNMIYGIPSQNDSDIWIIKTDAEGNKQWDKTYGGPLDEWVFTRKIVQANDGGYIINAMTQSYHVNPSKWCVMLLKIDGNGNELWNKTYGDPKQMTTSYSIDSTSDGGYVIALTKNHNGMQQPKDDMWLIKTDNNGNVEWDQIYGGNQIDRAYHVNQVSDGGYIMSGTTVSFTQGGDWDGCIVKYSSFDNNRPEKPEEPSGESRGSPGTEYTFTGIAVDPDNDQVFYKWDWGDGNYSEWLGPYSSGESCQTVHAWGIKATYAIRVMVKDQHGGESDWSDPMPITIPYSYNKIILPFFDLLFERFPNAFPLLRHHFGY
jgi:PKD domain